MAEPRELKPGEDPSEEGRLKLLKGRDPRAPRLLSGDKMANRASLYFVLFLLLFIGAFGPVRSEWRSGPSVHENLETLSTLLALVVGSLALVRFYSKKRGTFLFIGTGFLGTALLDTFHVVVSANMGRFNSLTEWQDRASWSFIGSGAFLSLFLFVSWLAWRREHGGPEKESIREGPVYLTAAFLAALIFVVFNVVEVTQAYFPESVIRQPAEFFPALFFLLALLGYLGKGHWRYDAFEHWVVMSLIFGFMAHAAYMPFSATFHDADFDTAHVLKFLSYGCVLIGLMASVFVTFRREEEAADLNREANASLAREIEVRRRAERILQESEERLQDFLDNAHDLIQSIGPQGEFLYVNRAWTEVLGYSEEELENLNFFDLLHPSCRDRCRQQFASVLEGEELPSVDVDFVAADGRLVRCSGSANARLQDGEFVATRSIFRDMTESYETRQELKAFQANLQALVENTGDAIWSVNRDLHLLTFNTAFSMGLEARTGREPHVDDGPEECFPSGDAPWYREMYQRSLRGEAFSELRDEETAGQSRSYELFFNPIREAGGITGVAVFSKDVTARRRTQLALRMAKEEAERASVAKSQFLANMSHELRTPLNSVIGFTNILLKNRGGNLVKQELGFLERISANGRHLLDLINEVLDLAKIEAGKMELDLQPTDLESLITETLAQLEAQVRDKDVVLRASIPPGLGKLELDAGKLRQVIINLLGNAIKFTDKGEVSVEAVTRDQGRTVSEIRVKDTGMGIPPERLQAIFEAFQQADGTTSRKFGGTGLGLAISRSLCQLMGYDLKVESEVDGGSTFTILMSDLAVTRRSAEEALIAEALKPIESSKPRPRGGELPASASNKERTHSVLIIDDDPDTRVLMRHYLEDLGCGIETAASAGEGIQKARANPPDLITLDLMMPGMNGWEALEELKADLLLRDIPVVIVSMLAAEGDESNVLGTVDLITKPVGREDLLRLVRRNLEADDGCNVLVVDDDPDVRTVLRDYLEDAGLHVTTAGDGEEAEESIETSLPDLILLDLVMPVMDGMTFLNRFRNTKVGSNIPIIICTGKELSRHESGRLHGQAAGIVAKGHGFEGRLKRVVAGLLNPRLEGGSS